MTQGRLVRGKQTEPDITLANGTRAFTSPVPGVLPTLAAHLATKAYVDSIVGTGLSKDDKDLTPALTSGNFSPTGLTITNTPPASSWVGVHVNNVGPYVLGDADKTKDCYFSSDGGTTALAIGAIVAGAQLIWNGGTAGFNFDGTRDKVSLVY
jgi:hypothetical protein